MQEWLQRQMASRFEAFAGTSISGAIHLSEPLLNEMLAELLAQARGEAPAPRPATDLHPILGLIESVRIRVADRAIVLDFTVRV